jgi:hypothetical protein
LELVSPHTRTARRLGNRTTFQVLEEFRTTGNMAFLARVAAVTPMDSTRCWAPLTTSSSGRLIGDLYSVDHLHRLPMSGFGHCVEPADYERSAAVGLDLDLCAVTWSDRGTGGGRA